MAETLAVLMKKGSGSGEQYEIIDGVESVAATGDTLIPVTSTQGKSPIMVYVETQGAIYNSFTEWYTNQFDDGVAVQARQRAASGYDSYTNTIGTLMNGAFISSIENNKVVLFHRAYGNYGGTSIKYHVVFE